MMKRDPMPDVLTWSELIKALLFAVLATIILPSAVLLLSVWDRWL